MKRTFFFECPLDTVGTYLMSTLIKKKEEILEQSQNVHQCLCAIQQSINGSKELHKRLVGLAFWQLYEEKKCGRNNALRIHAKFFIN